jgi:rhodanese-related sulfurtransferase
MTDPTPPIAPVPPVGPTPAPPTTEPPALRLLRLNWQQAARRDASGATTLPATFVAEQGQLVRILDVRDEAELCGPLGHIPQVTHVPLARLGEVPAVLAADTGVVVVSSRGERAAVAARYLEALGMQRVAALEGGMTAWKALGFTTLRSATTYRRTLMVLAPGVGRDGRPLVVESRKGALTVEQVQEHIGDSTSVRWVKLAAFLLHGKRSCVDGRDDHGVIGTPGGDAGEMLLGLAAAERVRGRPLSRAEIVQLLEQHIDTFGRFYLHSDTHAMNRLIVDGFRKDERIVPHLGRVFEPQEWRAFMAKPPPAVRGLLLEHLCRPENMGCGHLRFAMTHGSDYGVRAELAQQFLQAVHELRWAGTPEIDFVILGGDHVEGAVASVVVDGDLHSYTRVPLVSPMVAGTQMFVNHPQVTAFLRREQTAHLVEAGAVAPADEGALGEAIVALGTQQAGATLKRLAAGLPVFELRFARDGSATARGVGVVG